MESASDILEFIGLAGRLKKEKRKGWINKVRIANPESVADHSFRTALISMLIGDIKGFDTCKMMRMALIHDLGEALTGDITPEGMDRAKRDDLERTAMLSILSRLPEPLQSLYYGLWSELKEGRTQEARTVLEIDKLEMAIQAQEYIEEGWPKKDLEDFLTAGREGIKERLLLDLFEACTGVK